MDSDESWSSACSSDGSWSSCLQDHGFASKPWNPKTQLESNALFASKLYSSVLDAIPCRHCPGGLRFDLQIEWVKWAMIMEEGLQFRFNFAVQQQEARLSPVTQKDEKRQDASAITTEQWILPPPPLSVEVFPAKIANSRPFVSETVVLKEGLTLLKVQLSILHYYPLNTLLSSTECREMSHVSWVWAKLTILTLPIAYRKFDFHKYDWNSGMQILYNDGLAQVLSWFLLAYLHSVLGADEVSG
jgi:hypothetical protein